MFDENRNDQPDRIHLPKETLLIWSKDLIEIIPEVLLVKATSRCSRRLGTTEISTPNFYTTRPLPVHLHYSSPPSGPANRDTMKKRTEKDIRVVVGLPGETGTAFEKCFS